MKSHMEKQYHTADRIINLTNLNFTFAIRRTLNVVRSRRGCYGIATFIHHVRHDADAKRQSRSSVRAFTLFAQRHVEHGNPTTAWTVIF